LQILQLVLLLAKLARDLITPYKIDQEVGEKQNLAVSLRLTGYLAGVILVFLGALYQSPTLVGPEGLGFDQAYGQEVLRVFIYSLAGIVALNLVRLVMDRVILYKFKLEAEVVQGQNVGAGAAELGMYVATGLMIAGAVSGDAAGTELNAALVALAFFGLLNRQLSALETPAVNATRATAARNIENFFIASLPPMETIHLPKTAKSWSKSSSE